MVLNRITGAAWAVVVAVVVCAAAPEASAQTHADRAVSSSAPSGDGSMTNAITLNGIDGRASGTFDLELTAFTAEAWVRVSSVTISSISSGGSIVTYGRGSQQAFSMWMIPDAPGVEDSVSPRLQINFNNGTSRITPPVDVPVPFGQWAHIAMSYDNQTAQVYIDGQLAREESWGVAMNPLPGGMLALGREFPGISEWLGGELDEVRIWSRVLTQEEIQQGMMRTACPDDESLFAYYPFDEDTGTAVTDASGNGRDLTLVGGASLVNADAPVQPATDCVPCSIADLAQPFGELNFFDVSAFLSQMPDLNDDSLFNFFDVSLFLASYNAGCP